MIVNDLTNNIANNLTNDLTNNINIIKCTKYINHGLIL